MQVPSLPSSPTVQHIQPSATDTSRPQMMLYHGLGKHVWNISLADFSPYWLLGRVLAAVFYTTAMFFVKLSLLLLYRRVFDVDRFFKRWWFVMLYSIIHTVLAIVLSFLACRPPDAQWYVRPELFLLSHPLYIWQRRSYVDELT